jgi:hypothetical protein
MVYACALFKRIIHVGHNYCLKLRNKENTCDITLLMILHSNFERLVYHKEKRANANTW